MSNFFFVNCCGLTMLNITVKTVARADIAQDQKSGGAAGKAFRHIGADCFLTDCM
jgi:hypothetical protein